MEEQPELGSKPSLTLGMSILMSNVQTDPNFIILLISGDYLHKLIYMYY